MILKSLCMVIPACYLQLPHKSACQCYSRSSIHMITSWVAHRTPQLLCDFLHKPTLLKNNSLSILFMSPWGQNSWNFSKLSNKKDLKNRTGNWAILHYKSTKHIEIKIKRTHTVRKKTPYMVHPTLEKLTGLLWKSL